MSTVGKNFEELATLSPGLVRRYLQSQSWEIRRELPRAEVWARTLPVGRIEVMLPKDSRLIDYAEQLGYLLETLASSEDRPIPDVVRDITTSVVDVPSIRLFPMGVPSGSIPLTEGTRAFTSLRDLMVSAVYRATSLADGHPARAVEPGRKPNEVYEFLNRIRLGLTRPGSYILTAEVPLSSHQPEQLRLDSMGRAGGLPLARRVCLALYDGVFAAQQAAEQAQRTQDNEPFDRWAEEGLTANICESLVDLSSGGKLPYDLRIAWANTLPTDRGTAPLSFDEPLIERLAAGAEFLRQRFGMPGVTLVGTIAKMVRTPVRGPGTILVVANPEEEPSRSLRVYLDLESEDYAKAGTAHGAGDEVRVQGDLVREANRWWLRNVHEFQTRQVDSGE